MKYDDDEQCRKVQLAVEEAITQRNETQPQNEIQPWF